MEFRSLNITGFSGASLVLEKGELVLIEVRPLASVYLGAICDGRGTLMEYVELWVQDTASHASALSEGLTNSAIEARWGNTIDGFSAIADHGVWRGDWETEPLPVVCCDDGDANDWILCRDDALLKKNGLPSYSASAHRYLMAADGNNFLALSEDSPLSPNTGLASDTFGQRIVFNREGGCLMIRKAAGLDYSQFVDFLGGHELDSSHESLRVPVTDNYSIFADRNKSGQAGRGFIHGKSAVSERTAEVFFLKLCALRGAFEAVNRAVSSLRLPMGGLTADSFAIRLNQGAVGLPVLWSNQVGLVDSSRFVAMPLAHNGQAFPVALEPAQTSVYAAAKRLTRTSGFARIHVKKISPPDDLGKVVLSGVLRTDEALDPSRKDLLTMEVLLRGGRRVSILASVSGARQQRGEWNFISYPLNLPDDFDINGFGESGMLIEKVGFEILPCVGSSHDLYALGVLAVRTLLSKGVLADNLEHLQSLMDVYSEGFQSSEWATGLGDFSDFMMSPKGEHLAKYFGVSSIAEDVSLEQAEDAIPAGLWWNTIEWVCRLFPGGVPGSFCKDFDDFDARAPHVIFEDPIAKLDDLIEQARLLLFGNPIMSRDLLKVVQAVSSRGPK